MANKSKTKHLPEKLKLPHVRDAGFRTIWADSTVNAVHPNYIVITFSIDDTIIRAENMSKISTTPPGSAGAYKSDDVEQDGRRLDMVAVRLSLDQFKALVEAAMPKVQAILDASVPADEKPIAKNSGAD